jgi:hypothetical protein
LSNPSRGEEPAGEMTDGYGAMTIVALLNIGIAARRIRPVQGAGRQR